MSSNKPQIPPTPFERVAEAMKQACDLYDRLVRDKTIADNLERFDVARGLMIVSDHLMIARLVLAETLRKAARASEDL